MYKKCNLMTHLYYKYLWYVQLPDGKAAATIVRTCSSLQYICLTDGDVLYDELLRRKCGTLHNPYMYLDITWRLRLVGHCACMTSTMPHASLSYTWDPMRSADVP